MDPAFRGGDRGRDYGAACTHTFNSTVSRIEATTEIRIMPRQPRPPPSGRKSQRPMRTDGSAIWRGRTDVGEHRVGRGLDRYVTQRDDSDRFPALDDRQAAHVAGSHQLHGVVDGVRWR